MNALILGTVQHVAGREIRIGFLSESRRTRGEQIILTAKWQMKSFLAHGLMLLGFRANMPQCEAVLASHRTI